MPTEHDDVRPTSGADTTINLGGPLPPEAESHSPVGLTAEEAAAVQSLPPTSALLVMQRGPSSGARFLLDADRTTVGRATSSDIFLDDVTVSRRHAEFVREGQGFVVRDVGSLNGTYLNLDRIEQAPLRSGDEVQIGKFRMTFYPSPHRDQVAG